MKKILFIFIVVCLFVSCSDDAKYKDKCYQYSYVMHPDGTSVSVNGYAWLSEHDIECQKALFTKYGYTDIKYKRAYKYKTIIDCVAADEHINSVYGQKASN